MLATLERCDSLLHRLNVIGSQRFSVNGYRIMQTIKGYYSNFLSRILFVCFIGLSKVSSHLCSYGHPLSVHDH